MVQHLKTGQHQLIIGGLKGTYCGAGRHEIYHEDYIVPNFLSSFKITKTQNCFLECQQQPSKSLQWKPPLCSHKAVWMNYKFQTNFVFYHSPIVLSAEIYSNILFQDQQHLFLTEKLFNFYSISHKNEDLFSKSSFM